MNLSKLENLLFIEIQSAGVQPHLSNLCYKASALWQKKQIISTRAQSENRINPEEKYNEDVGLYAELARVICISFGYFERKEDELILITKSIENNIETELLIEAKQIIEEFYSLSKTRALVGFNILKFDIPFFIRRLLINGLEIPSNLDFTIKKPWEYNDLIDLLTIWKAGNYRDSITLEDLAWCLGIELNNTLFPRKKVHEVYWSMKDKTSIIQLSEQLLHTIAECFIKLKFPSQKAEIKLLSKTKIEVA